MARYFDPINNPIAKLYHLGLIVEIMLGIAMETREEIITVFNNMEVRVIPGDTKSEVMTRFNQKYMALAIH